MNISLIKKEMIKINRMMNKKNKNFEHLCIFTIN